MKSTWHRRAWIAATGAVALAVALVAVVWIMDPGAPRGLGKSRHHWFPRLVFSPEWSDASQAARCEKLAAAGPEMMPVLVDAASGEDSAAMIAFSDLREMVPPGNLRNLLPRPWPAASVRRAVWEILRTACEREAVFRAFTNAWDEFPESIQRRALKWMASHTSQPDIARPVLLRVLSSTDPSMVESAASALFQYPLKDPAEVETIIRRLSALEDSRFETAGGGGRSVETYGDLFTRELAALGGTAAGAEPWMLRWLASSSPRLRAYAVGTLPAIAPDRYPIAELLARHLEGPPALQLADLISSNRVMRTRTLIPWPEIVPVVARLLPASEPRVTPPDQPGDDSIAEQWNRSLVILRFLEQLGPEAAPAAASIPPLLQDPGLALPAAMALARIGPVAPGTIPQLLPGLSNAQTAPPLILLLAAYGPAARIAEPELMRLAHGDAPLGWQTGYAGPIGLPHLAPPGETVIRSGELSVSVAVANRTGLRRFWPMVPPTSGNPDAEFSPQPRAEGMPETRDAELAPDRLVLISTLAQESLRHIRRGPTPAGTDVAR